MIPNPRPLRKQRERKKREDWLAAFVMASILLNSQLMTYSAALGTKALIVRIFTCFLCGCTVGLLVFLFFLRKEITDSHSRHSLFFGGCLFA